MTKRLNSNSRAVNHQDMVSDILKNDTCFTITVTFNIYYSNYYYIYAEFIMNLPVTNLLQILKITVQDMCYDFCFIDNIV